ncbi:mechanosensitive ion channel domain-containing protein [Bradyrhizobium sp. LHD-71]|uniref:mechanosensitive ion channel domain-containing protein n=1 Tax=Bradyrhizobium sp. LHD-71 TaxID=3072141 RepID=UPI00280C6950|nr:mechanosensitive ion channel domain-containing protein [Bradyrhizobium sp. LHD-71]MDQ8726650.1 mechanosensitive ion channel [Bradyrhizobium sp. LHD-71]
MVLALALAVQGLALNPALAQTPAKPAASAASAAPAGAVTPDDARRALEVLQNESKRTELISTLRALANAQPPQAAPGAKTEAAGEAKELPLAADSLGAQLLLQVSEQFATISDEIAAAAGALTRLPLLWHWLKRSATDPATYDLLFDIAWKLTVVLGCALAVAWLMRRVVRRPIALLEAWMPKSALPAAPPIAPAMAIDGASAAFGEGPRADAQVRQRNVRLAQAWSTVVRLPFVLGRFVLEVLPIIAFAAVGNLLLGSRIGDNTISKLAILAVVNAYVLRGIVICLARMLVSSEPLSLFTVRGEAAAYIHIWVNRIATVGIFGVTLANVALLLGLYRPGYFALLRLVMLMVHLLVVVVILQGRRTVADLIRTDARNGVMAAMRNRLANFWHYIAIVLVLGLWAVWALNIRNGYALLFQYVVGTIAVVLVSRLLLIVIVSVIDRVFRVPPEIVERFPGIEVRANRYLPMARRIVSYFVAIIGFVALLEVWGVDAITWFATGQIGSRLLSAIVTVGIAVLIAAAVWEISNALLDRQLSRFSQEGQFAKAARLRTFLPMLRTTLLCVIVAVVALTALSEIGVNVAPLLAGAGIIGIAIGFGSQKLVQDVITGLFLLLENVVHVGDVVTVSDLTGTVENVSIRTIRLRAADGAVHIVPFSAVTSVTNRSRGMGNAAISVTIPSGEDTEQVEKILNEIATEMRAEPKYNHLIRDDLELWGIDKLNGSKISMVGQIRCTDAGRWPVQREFNRRMLRRFKEHGVEIATG